MSSSNKNPFFAQQPSSQSNVRLDGSFVENAITGMGIEGVDKSAATTVGQGTRLSRRELEVLYQHQICQRICNALPDSAIEKGWVLQRGDDINEKIFGESQKYINNLKLAENFTKAQKWANLYGGAAIVIAVDDDRLPHEPVDIDNIKKIKWLEVFDRWDILPDLQSIWNPEKVQHYVLQVSPSQQSKELATLFEAGKPGLQYKIHKSRIIRFDGVPYPPKISRDYYDGWGGSVLDLVWQEFRSWRSSMHSIDAMLQDFSLFVYSIKGLASMMASATVEDERKLQRRLKQLQMMSSVFGGVAVDADGENVQWATRNFNGVESLVNLTRDALIGVSGIPHTKLFGESPSGLGATGENEQRDWAQKVKEFQESRWKNPILEFYQLMFRAKNSPTKGNLPDDFDIDFPSILTQSDSEIVGTRSQQATIDDTYINAGVLLPEEVRLSRFGAAEYSLETTLDDEAWEESKQEEEPADDGFGGGFDFSNLFGEEETDKLEEEGEPNENQNFDLGLNQDSIYHLDSNDFEDKTAFDIAVSETKDKFRILSSQYARNYTLRRYKELAMRP